MPTLPGVPSSGTPDRSQTPSGVTPQRGKVFKEGLPLDNYSMDQFRLNEMERTTRVESGAVHDDMEPVNMNPEISTPAPSPEKFGMGRGPHGAN